MQKWGTRSIFNSVSLCLNFTGFGLLLWASGSDVVVQLLSCAWLFETLWTAACQASLSYTVSWSSSNSCPLSWCCQLNANHLILCCPFSSCPPSFPASGSFSMSQLFVSGGQSIGASASAAVLPVTIQGWFLLGLTGLILQSMGLSRDCCNCAALQTTPKLSEEKWSVCCSAVSDSFWQPRM